MVNLAVQALANENQLQATVDWGNNTEATFSGKLQAVAHFNKSEEEGQLNTRIQIHPSRIILNDSIWNIHPSEVVINKGIIDVHDFLFEHQDQYVRANGRIGKAETDSCLVDLGRPAQHQPAIHHGHYPIPCREIQRTDYRTGPPASRIG